MQKNPELLRLIHRQIHEAMASGLVPVSLDVGWMQYGELYALHADEPDSAAPREVFGLPVRLLKTPDLLVVRSRPRDGL